MLRAALRQLHASDPQFGADGHVPIIGGRSGAYVQSRLEYENGMLSGLPTHLVRRLQSVQNVVPWSIRKLRRFDHMIDALLVGLF